MKKLALKVEDLEVVTFVTDVSPEERGTVHGQSLSDGWTLHLTDCGLSFLDDCAPGPETRSLC